MFEVISTHIFNNWENYFPGEKSVGKFRPLFARGDKWNIIYIFGDRRQQPLCVIELLYGESDLLARAADNMRELEKNINLRRHCPKVFYFGKLGANFALIQEFCRGIPILFLLQRKSYLMRSGRIGRNVMLATKLLVKLHTFTKEEVILDQVYLRNCFRPLFEKADGNRPFLDIIGRLENKRLPLVMSHNDYIPSNILVDERDNLRVLDWEYATKKDLPLVDLFIFLLRAYRNIKKSPEELDMFVKELFLANNFFSKILRENITFYCRQMGIDRDTAIVIFLSWLSTYFKSDKPLRDFLTDTNNLLNFI